MRILCISGSPSPTAWSYSMLSAIAKKLVDRGCEVDLLDLRTCAVPVLDTVAYHAGGPYPHAMGEELRARVAAADGVVIATSVHHASYSGLLKSALDHLEAGAFRDKPVALLANAGAVRGAATACEHLRTVVKAMSGWSIPTQIATAPADFDPQTRELRSAALLRRCDDVCAELTDFVTAMASIRPIRE